MGALATKSRPSRRRDHSEDGVAALCIGGEIVLVDTQDTYADGKDLFAVLLMNGNIELQYARLASDRSYLGRRTGFFGQGDKSVNGSIRLVGCAILGRVLSEGQRVKEDGGAMVERLAEQLSAAVEREYGGDYEVTIQSGGRIDYRWAKPQAA